VNIGDRRRVPGLDLSRANMGMQGREVVGVCDEQRTKEGVTEVVCVHCSHVAEDMSKDCRRGWKKRP
jgi:hypothetical protein